MPRVMGALRRLATLLAALLLLAAGLLIVLLSLTLIPPMQSALPGIHLSTDIHTLGVWLRMGWLAAGMAGALLGLVLLVASTARPHGEGRWIVLQRRRGRAAGNTTVSISRRAVHAMAAHTAERVEGVLDSHPRLRLGRKGWIADCEILVHPDRRPAAEVLRDVERVLRQGLHEQTGFSVHRLDVRGRFEPFDPRRRVL